MFEFLESTGYMPHGYCLLWEPWLVTLYAGSDLLIFASYAVIPFAILRLVRMRPDIGNRGLLTLFASFILLCGLTHLVSVAILWVPAYALHGWLKLVTGLVSAITAIVLFPLVPKLAALPSPSNLQEANDALRAEIDAHHETLSRLRTARDGLEAEVAERTAELQAANDQMTIVLEETAHQHNNMVTVIQSLARQTARTCADMESFQRKFGERLIAMARATNATARGMGDEHGNLSRIVQLQLAAYIETYEHRIEINGPSLPINTTAAQQIGLVLHELATNAVKYGSLATPEGRVHIAWSISGRKAAPQFELSWTETGMDGSTNSPDTETHSGGLGSRLVNFVVPSQLGGTADSEMAASGLIYRLSVPAARIQPENTADAPAAPSHGLPGLTPG